MRYARAGESKTERRSLDTVRNALRQYRPVSPQSGLSATGTRIPVDIRRFPWIRRLADDYAFDFAKVATFFAGDPADPAAWRDATARVQRFARPRDQVADILHAQQTRRAAPPESIAAAGQLRDPRTVAVVTGQQAGLFGGPLFTLLKALTAIGLAERVRAEQGVPAVPIFWIDAEDHDWDEVKACGVPDVDQRLTHISLDDPAGANERPVGSIDIDSSAPRVLDELQRTLAGTDFTADLLAQLRLAYGPGMRMSDAFGRWLEAVLGSKGLVVYDASDVRAKPLVAGLFAAEIEHAGRTTRLAAAAGTALEVSGYHAQATAADGSVALFQFEGGRVPIRHQDGRFRVGDRDWSQEELLAHVRRSPEQFSPNVLLRPLVQDTIFPTVCYVAGPNELAYLGQLRAVYEAFGVPMPLMHQRVSATILDTNAMRFLTRHEVPLESLHAHDEAALNQLLEAQLPPSVEASIAEAHRTLTERMEAVAQAMPQIDATLEGAARSALGRMHDDLKKLHGKVIQAAKRKDDTLRRQFTNAQAQAFPGGQPQERAIGFVYFLNKFGPALIDRLAEDLPLEMGHHWIVTL